MTYPQSADPRGPDNPQPHHFAKTTLPPSLALRSPITPTTA